MDDEDLDDEGVDLEFYITGLVYGLTFLVGLVGNSLIVYSVAHFKRMKSLSNVFLASLATADLILVIFCVPVKFAQLFSYSWTFGVFLCKFVHYIQNMCAICSVYTLTAMSIERYYAIIYPVECRSICTMSQSKKVIILTWIGSFILAAPIIWMQKHLKVGDPEHTAHWCVRDWDNKLYWQLYELYMLITILIIPLIIMTYSYSKICKRLWSVMRDRPNTLFPLSLASTSASYNNNTIDSVICETSISNLDANNQSRQSISQQLGPKVTITSNPRQLHNIYIDSSYKKMSQVIKMLIVVVIVFVICWTPILVINVLTAFGVLERLNYGYMKGVKTAFHLLSYFNSCINPIIYGFLSRSFLASFKTVLTKIWCLEKKNKQIVM